VPEGSHLRVVSWKHSSPERRVVVHPEASSAARFAVAGLLKAALVAVSAVPRTEEMSKGAQGGGGIGADCCLGCIVIEGAVGCEIAVSSGSSSICRLVVVVGRAR
jgi:hypothetical protein